MRLFVPTTVRPQRGAALVALALLLAGGASAAPEGRPRSIPWLGTWNDHDPARPTPGYETWTPADVVNMLAAHPGAVAELGIHDGLPPGNVIWQRRGAAKREIEQRAAAVGVDVAGRVCMKFRPDVHRKLVEDGDGCAVYDGGGGCDWEGDMDGRLGEAESVVKRAGRASEGGSDTLRDGSASWSRDRFVHRLLVLRPGSGIEERRRIVANDARTLGVDAPWALPPRAGDAYEIRGSFDPAWVVRVPRSTHEASVDRFWSQRRDVCGRNFDEPCAGPAEPLDPLAAGNRRGWASGIDRAAIEALVNPLGVPALYGLNRDRNPLAPPWTDPYLGVTAVVMDLRDERYRDWSIRYLQYKLEDFGFEPGAPACLMLVYKPGFYTAYDDAVDGPSTSACAMPDSGSWEAPAHICSEVDVQGGPLNPTPYAPGEFEASVNAYVREMLQALAGRGYEDLRLVTVERPTHRGRPWSILEADLRFHAQLVGELGSAIEPRLADVPVLTPPAPPDPPDPPAPPVPPPVPPVDPGTGAGGGASGSDGGSPPARGSGGVTPSAGGRILSSGGGGGGTVEPPSLR